MLNRRDTNIVKNSFYIKLITKLIEKKFQRQFASRNCLNTASDIIKLMLLNSCIEIMERLALKTNWRHARCCAYLQKCNFTNKQHMQCIKPIALRVTTKLERNWLFEVGWEHIIIVV